MVKAATGAATGRTEGIHVPTDHPAPGEGQLIRTVRQHLLLLGIVTFITTALAVTVGFLQGTSYTATTSVLVTPLEGNPYSPEGRGDDLINLETEAQLVTTDTVAKLAAGQLPGSDPARLRAKVSVSVPPNTQVLNISYTDQSARGARDGAQAFANAYLQHREQRAKAVTDGQMAKLREQAQRVERALQQATRQLSGANATERAFLNQRITAYTNQLGVIDEQINTIASTPIDPGQIITPAGLPKSSGHMMLLIYGAAGLVAGLVLGTGLALVRTRLDKRLRDAESVEALGLRTLSTIPEAPSSGEELVLVTQPDGPQAEGYRRLRAAVVAGAPGKQYVILVASATPGGTVTLTAANLAVALAFAGSPTIMIDATASAADPLELFGLSPAKGLSDTLISGTDPATLLIHADSNLRLLPRGRDAAQATHRFSGPLMRSTIKAMRRRSDYVVINGPSLHDADAQALCTLADAVLLVVSRGVTTRQDLIQARIEAQRAGATVIGAVLESSPLPIAKPGRKPDRRPGTTERRAGESSTDTAPIPAPVPDPEDEPVVWEELVTGRKPVKDGHDIRLPGDRDNGSAAEEYPTDRRVAPTRRSEQQEEFSMKPSGKTGSGDGDI